MHSVRVTDVLKALRDVVEPSAKVDVRVEAEACDADEHSVEAVGKDVTKDLRLGALPERREGHDVGGSAGALDSQALVVAEDGAAHQGVGAKVGGAAERERAKGGLVGVGDVAMRQRGRAHEREVGAAGEEGHSDAARGLEER
jgi:hypothetical protein